MKPPKPVLLSLSLLVALQPFAGAELVERVIVRVNGDIVTQSEFEARQVASVQAARIGASEVERYLRENNAQDPAGGGRRAAARAARGGARATRSPPPTWTR